MKTKVRTQLIQDLEATEEVAQALRLLPHWPDGTERGASRSQLTERRKLHHQTNVLLTKHFEIFERLEAEFVKDLWISHPPHDPGFNERNLRLAKERSLGQARVLDEGYKAVFGPYGIRPTRALLMCDYLCNICVGVALDATRRIREGLLVELDRLEKRPEDNDLICSPGFTSIRWRGAEYHFNPTQARFLQELHLALESGLPWVGTERLREAVTSSAEPYRPRDTFKGHPAWGVLIISDSKGRYRLTDAPND